jgi:hypothetical protein
MLLLPAALFNDRAEETSPQSGVLFSALKMGAQKNSKSFGVSGEGKPLRALLIGSK